MKYKNQSNLKPNTIQSQDYEYEYLQFLIKQANSDPEIKSFYKSLCKAHLEKQITELKNQMSLLQIEGLIKKDQEVYNLNEQENKRKIVDFIESKIDYFLIPNQSTQIQLEEDFIKKFYNFTNTIEQQLEGQQIEGNNESQISIDKKKPNKRKVKSKSNKGKKAKPIKQQEKQQQQKEVEVVKKKIKKFDTQNLIQTTLKQFTRQAEQKQKLLEMEKDKTKKQKGKQTTNENNQKKKKPLQLKKKTRNFKAKTNQKQTQAKGNKKQNNTKGSKMRKGLGRGKGKGKTGKK